jgi:hypothetical protein
MSASKQKYRSIVRISKAKLTKMIEQATADAYGDSEQVTGWITMIEENLLVPFKMAVVGVEVIGQRVDLDHHEHIITACRGGRAWQPPSILDLPLPPTPPPDGAEWIEAYQRWQAENR